MLALHKKIETLQGFSFALAIRVKRQLWVKTSRSRRSTGMSDLAENGHSARHGTMSGIRHKQAWRVPLGGM